MNTAISIARPGGAVGRVGVPQEQTIPGSEPAFYNNVTVGGGPAPVRAYIEDLLPDVLEGNIEPGRVFDRMVDPAFRSTLPLSSSIVIRTPFCSATALFDKLATGNGA